MSLGHQREMLPKASKAGAPLRVLAPMGWEERGAWDCHRLGNPYGSWWG